MPIFNNSGIEATDITLNGVPANMATLNGVVVWSRVSDMNGTAAFGGFVNVGGTSGGVASIVFGTFSGYTPLTGTGPSIQQFVTITQTRTRSVTRNTTAVTQLQRAICNEVTPPTGTGVPGTCGVTPIGGATSRTLTIANATSVSLARSEANGGIESRTQLVLNTAYSNNFMFSDWNGVVSISSTGTVFATMGNASVISFVPATVGPNMTGVDVTHTITVTVQTDDSTFTNPDTDVVGTVDVVQPAVIIMRTVTFVVAGSVANANIGTPASITRPVGDPFFFNLGVGPQTDFEFNSILNVGTTITPTGLGQGTPTISPFGGWTRRVSGTIPATDTTYTITFSGAAISTLTPATAGSIDFVVFGVVRTEINFLGALGGIATININGVAPADGTWNITTDMPGGVITPATGEGNAAVTVRAIRPTPLGSYSVFLRSTSGALLDTFPIVVA